MTKLPLIAAVAAMTAASIVPAAAADAHGHGYYKHQRYAQQYDNRDYNDGSQGGRYYDQRSYGSTRCRSGTTGAIVGAAAGALLGRSILGRGNHTTGTILGAAAGGLGGRELTRDRNCR